LSLSSIKEFYRNRYSREIPEGQGAEAEGTFSLRIEAAINAIGESPKRVLDFGCNMGAASKALAASGHRVVGVDISEPAVLVARSRVPTARFEVIDSESSLPFQDASFDVCFSTEVIEHLFDVRGFVREICRVLVPGGLFLITTPYHGWLKNLLIITGNFDRHFSPTGGHIRFFSRKSLSTCLDANGFRVESVRGLGRYWPIWKTIFVAARKRTDEQ
jgi:2-polyprenyl-3-methyl-5-hydroxy-6-metoxy-1,4-benzoquinol methylase